MRTKILILFAIIIGAHCNVTLHANDSDTVWTKPINKPAGYALYIDISPDNKYILVSHKDFGIYQEAILFDLKTGEKLNTISPIFRAMFTKDSKYILGYTPNKFTFFDIFNWKFIERFEGSLYYLGNQLVFNDDSTKIIQPLDSDEGYCIWDIETGKIENVQTYDVNEDNVEYSSTYNIGFTKNDNNIIYTVIYGERPPIINYWWWLRIKDRINHNLLFQKKNRSRVIVSPQEKYFFCQGEENNIAYEIYDLNTILPLISQKGTTDGLFDIKFSYDDKYLALIDKSQAKIIIWDLNKQKNVYEYKGYYQYIAFSSDGKYLAAGTNEKLYLFNTPYNLVNVEEEKINEEIIYPNPTNGSINVHFELNNPSHLNFNLYDISGLLISNLKNQFYNAGSINENLLLGNLANGIYYLKIESLKFNKTYKLIINK